MESREINYDADAEINEIILRLDLTLVRPDQDEDSADVPKQNGGDPTTTGKTQNGVVATKSKSAAGSGKSASENSGSAEDEKKKSSGARDFIRRLRLSSSDRKDGGCSAETGNKRKTSDVEEIETLPQKFIAKYIGCKACRGLWGVQHTREPIDALVEDLQLLAPGEDLPLVRLDVSTSGIAMAVHPRSRARRPPTELGLLPLEFISYAVRDTRFSRIFAFILVRELSSRGRATECHAYLCDSTSTARRLALSVALAFRTVEQSLNGKPFRFGVDLKATTDGDGGGGRKDEVGQTVAEDDNLQPGSDV